MPVADESECSCDEETLGVGRHVEIKQQSLQCDSHDRVERGSRQTLVSVAPRDPNTANNFFDLWYVRWDQDLRKANRMDTQLVIHLKTGHKIEGRLARSFSNNDADIKVHVADNQRQLLFALDEICTVHFKEVPPWALSEKPTAIVDVQTTAGETFRVAAFPNKSFLKGLIGLDQDETAAFRTIFFTFSGIRSRKEVRRIGEILEDSGFVTKDRLTEALKTQDELRSRRIGDIIAEAEDIPHSTIEKMIQEASENPKIPRNVRVGDILVEYGLVTQDQVEKAFEAQHKGRRQRIGALLVSQGLITEEQLLCALAKKFPASFRRSRNHCTL